MPLNFAGHGTLQRRRPVQNFDDEGRLPRRALGLRRGAHVTMHVRMCLVIVIA